jgi:hypothetical protein
MRAIRGESPPSPGCGRRVDTAAPPTADTRRFQLSTTPGRCGPIRVPLDKGTWCFGVAGAGSRGRRRDTGAVALPALWPSTGGAAPGLDHRATQAGRSPAEAGLRVGQSRQGEN